MVRSAYLSGERMHAPASLPMSWTEARKMGLVGGTESGNLPFVMILGRVYLHGEVGRRSLGGQGGRREIGR
jgi:hypothetical protein